uniref:PHD finger transcription factor n=1 Tax=Cucumis melo TaxID=3656 RepID=A0A9I9EKT2_CUCME
MRGENQKKMKGGNKKKRKLHGDYILRPPWNYKQRPHKIRTSHVKGTGRKRKRRTERRLIVDEKVEVRSLEDGFLGSWHGGTVVACDNGVRLVKYDHLLRDDGSDLLVDAISVSATLDDVNFLSGNTDVRGNLRPIPPTVDFGKWDLPYGLCVDVNYLDAWWEGVIFDHEDGSDERKVFFPDLGDELTVGIETMRITQDWDEVTGNWQRRGTWLFLELIDQCEQESYLPVSLKQIWYEVRGKEDFIKIRKWTSPMNDLWKELVMEVIKENLDVTLKEMLRVLESSSSVGCELGKICVVKNPSIDFVNVDADAITGESEKSNTMIRTDFNQEIAYDALGSVMKEVHTLDRSYFNQENVFDSLGLVNEEVHAHDSLDAELLDSGPSSINFHLALGKSQLDDDTKMKTSNDLDFSCRDEALSTLPKGSSSKASDAEVLSGASGSISHQQLPITENKNVKKQPKCSGRESSFKWETLSATTPLDAASCPDAVTEYSLLGKEKPKQALVENVCKLLEELPVEITPSVSKNETKIMQGSGRERSLSPNNCFQTTLDGSGVALGQPRLLHKAVMDYYNMSQLGSNGEKGVVKMQSEARRHLLSLGWGMLVTQKGKGNKQRWNYTSPLGRTCTSLSTACKICLDEEGVYQSTDSPGRTMENMFLIQKADGQLVSNTFYSAPSNVDVQECSMPSDSIGTSLGKSPGISPSKYLMEFSHNKSQRCEKVISMTNVFDFSSHLPQSQHNLDGKACESGVQTVCKKYARRIRSPEAVKQELNRGRVSAGINKFSDDMENRRSIRVSRSSKRVHEVVTPSPSHHNPRTILSWLIDNNMVLPRAKVYYCRGKNRRPMAEGRISRDGIKCCCCQKLYTINGFEIHAGGTSSRSAANILLEDGKSLLECQILCNKKTRSFKNQASACRKGDFSKGENDYICSICHFGGTLILCDQCPSSFHQSCLGLKDVPEGDWFCPSCCCGICGQKKLSEHANITFNAYGVPKSLEAVLNLIGFVTNIIYWGLQKLLGKSIPVGGDNLTWSLLKAPSSDTDYFNPPHLDTLTENQSKLNVALSVIHECFEPVREQHTRRDIVEDVLFSRRSELKRLNFQGFYTVLLERNDELVSVAAIRVYGEKVAEVPLVGTRFQYRRLGMCRILMNELEEKHDITKLRLRGMGVQRLVLPAVPSVLNAWTTSFGFSKMTDSERSEFLNYTFLDFQETVMCQKFLLKNTVVPSSLSDLYLTILAGKSDLHDAANKNKNSSDNICGSSVITELHPTAHNEGSILQEQVEISATNTSDNNSPSLVVNVGKLKNHLQNNSTSHIEQYPTCSAGGFKRFEGLQENTRDYLKYYRRRNKKFSWEGLTNDTLLADLHTLHCSHIVCTFKAYNLQDMIYHKARRQPYYNPILAKDFYSWCANLHSRNAIDYLRWGDVYTICLISISCSMNSKCSST